MPAPWEGGERNGAVTDRGAGRDAYARELRAQMAEKDARNYQQQRPHQGQQQRQEGERTPPESMRFISHTVGFCRRFSSSTSTSTSSSSPLPLPLLLSLKSSGCRRKCGNSTSCHQAIISGAAAAATATAASIWIFRSLRTRGWRLCQPRA